MASVTREQIGNLHDKISIKIDKQDYLPDFEKDIRQFSKRANIPGFRRGMVPAGLIKKMYGPEFYQDAVIKSANKELQNYLEKEQLDIFGQPIQSDSSIPDLDLKNPAEYEFLFEIGRKPEIKIDLSSIKKPIRYKIKPKPEDLKDRLDSLQTQFGELKETDVVVNGDNIIKIQINQIDENGQPVEKGISSEQSLYVKVFTESFQKELTGKKKDDVLKGKLNDIVNSEQYPGVYENLGIAHDDNEKKNASVSVTIITVNNMDKHPLDEDLFKKAYPSKNIQSEEELKSAIEADEQRQWDELTGDQLDHDLYHSLMETSAEFPEDFLKKLLRVTEKEKTEEDITKEMPSFLNELKWSLIIQQIVKDNDLKVTSDDIRAEVRKELAKYFGGADLNSEEFAWTESYVDRVLSDKEQLESRYSKLRVGKVFDWVRSQIEPEEKEISQEDFLKIREEHHHTH